MNMSGMSANSSRLVKALVISIGLLLLQPSGAFAGTITFFDLTDTVTVSLSSDLIARGSTFSCAGERCTVTLPPPLLPGTLGVNFNSTQIFEPNSTLLSDTILVAFPSFPTATITFTSDTEGVPLPPLPGTNPSMFEDGTVQLASSIFWHFNVGGVITDATDNISFQSDVVPEPSTFLLLGTGFLGFLGYGWRKKLHS